MRGEEQLKEEIQEFQKDKERVRSIVSEIDGGSRREAKIVNILLTIIIATLFVLGVVFKRITPSLAVQVAILFSVLKLIWMFYDFQKVNHFQFWILNSLEFRINEIHKKVRKIEKELEREKNANRDKNSERVDDSKV